jgi:hypothetical protein
MSPAREPEAWVEVDEQDKKTPDAWVARHPKLVSLFKVLGSRVVY